MMCVITPHAQRRGGSGRRRRGGFSVREQGRDAAVHVDAGGGAVIGDETM